jgi:hypothetical protein
MMSQNLMEKSKNTQKSKNILSIHKAGGRLPPCQKTGSVKKHKIRDKNNSSSLIG